MESNIRLEATREVSARNAANTFLNALKHKKGEARIKTAKELYRFIHIDIKDESHQYIMEFIASLDSAKDHNAVIDYINSPDVEDKKAGIFLIVCLLEASHSGETNRVNRYANYLLKTLTLPNVDEAAMEFAARGISYLIQTSKVGELVTKCMDQCLEWLEETERQEKRRLAAALLTRELALFTSTSFFLRADTFFRNIFKVILDPKPNVRLAAMSALHAALTITSQREAKQKTEWYQECFHEAVRTEVCRDLSRDDKWHSMLLVFNELVKISDANYERDRMSCLGHEVTSHVGGSTNPMDWLTEPRAMHIVESRTAKALISENINTILDQALAARAAKSPHVQCILLELFPRLCAWTNYPNKPRRDKEMFDYCISQVKSNLSLAIPSLGMFFVLQPDRFRDEVKHVIGLITAAIEQDNKKFHSVWGSLAINFKLADLDRSTKTTVPFSAPRIHRVEGNKKKAFDPSLFIFLKLFVRAYKESVAEEIKTILPPIMSRGLNKGLCRSLREILTAIPNDKSKFEEGLLLHCCKALTGVEVEENDPIPATITEPPHPINAQNVQDYCLALETMGHFGFPRHNLLKYMSFVAETYLVCNNIEVRLAAVKCCIAMIHPFVQVYENMHREHKDFVLETVQNSLSKLVSVGVIDSSVDVRLSVMDCLAQSHISLLNHLSQPQMMDMLFMCLHDEKPEMQVSAVKLMGRLTSLNPAFVQPRLRRILLDAVSQLMTSGSPRLQQHSARLIAQLTKQGPDFVKPYVSGLVRALIPFIRIESRNTDVTVNVIDAINELSVVGGLEIVKSIQVLFDRLCYFLADGSNRRRRESSLTAIVRICRSTAYVVDPYKDHPQLLDDLLKLLKSDHSSTIRKQIIQVLGVLGALDPYTHKMFIGDVQSASSISTALSMPSSRDKSDPRQEIIQWFNYEKYTLEEFYPSITIANLMLMVQEESYNAYYDQITQALLTIFKSLTSDEYKIYVEQVFPRLLEVTRSCRPEHKRFFLTQLASLVEIVQLHAKQYMTDIFHLIADAWSDEASMKLTIVQVMEQMGTALGTDFSNHVPTLIPYLLKVMQSERGHERRLTAQVLSCVRSLSGCLTPHLHLILPPVLAILNDTSIQMRVRESALETILFLAESEEISEFAPRLMQAWLRSIDVVPLQPMLLKLLVVVAKQMWKHFDIYRRSVDAALAKHGLRSTDYEELTRTIAGLMLREMEKGCKGAPHPVLFSRQIQRPVARPAQTVARLNKQKFNVEVVRAAWQISSLVSREDWTQWLSKLRIACLKMSSSAALRAAAPLAEQHSHLAKDLFNAAFMSTWTELSEMEQREVTDSLQTALSTSGHADVVQSILNLAEFMDHSEKGPLPIDCEALGRSAEQTKAYAKALRYKEIDIYRRNKHRGEITAHDCHALITFANKLNVQDEAAGVVAYAERHKMDIAMQGKWYEKLNEWEKALESYKQNPTQENVAQNEMRCLEALGRWGELNTRADLETAQRNHKVAVMGARGAWAVGDWERMAKFVNLLNANSQDGAFLRAVLAVKNEEYITANSLISRVRDMYDSELTALASESYERAYGAMVTVQQLAELEEAIEYTMRLDRRPRIALLWSRRLMGCRQNVEQWQRLLMLRALVMKPQEMHPLRVKFASLCRKQGRVEMSREVLRQLLELPPNAELHKANPPQDKPALVIAFCKQLWMDGLKGAAISTMDGLARHMERVCAGPKATAEQRRIAAKVYVKLGEWTEPQATALLDSNTPVRTSPKLSAVITNGTDEGSQMSQSTVEGISASMSIPSMTRSVGSTPLHSPNSIQQSAIMRQAIKYYSRATELDRGWHKAWHSLATSYYAAMQREKEKAAGRKSSVQMAPQLVLPPMVPLGQQLSFSHVGPGAPAPLAPALPGALNVSTIQPTQPLLTFQTSPHPVSDHHLSSRGYANQAIKCFVEALKLAQGSRLEDTLRLLALLFDIGTSDHEIKSDLKKLPSQMWLEVVPQLIARLDSAPNMAELIKQIIIDVSKEYPQALVYALTVASKSPNHERMKNARDLVEQFSEMSARHKKLAEQAKILTEELVRCAILWHEQWHESLDEASRLYFQDKNFAGMLEILEPLHRMIEAGANTIKEQSFNQTYFADLQDARKFCQAYVRTKNTKELTQAWEIYYSVFKRVQNQLRQLQTLDLTYISPRLKEARNLEISIPGTYDPQHEVVTISWLDTHLQVITSKQRPRRLTMRGSNGKDYQFLLKGHEDPRQDERVMQLFGLVNTLLVINPETCRRNLTIQRYSIVALSQNSGLIGWVPNCDTLHTLVREYRDKKKISLSIEHKEMQQHATDLEQLTLLQKVQLFQMALRKTTGDDLQQILWLKSPSSEVWFDRRTNYTRSMAVMSMVGYILGLGDRHPSNLMLDRLTGKIVHIDFGDCFEVAMTREKFPEKIPFRLTRMLIKAMEVTGIEGNYRHTCERVLRLLRSNKDSLLAVLEAFVYDPLINWRLLDVNKRNPGEKTDLSKMKMDEALPESVSRKIVDRIKHKLTGRDFEYEREIGASEQVNRLVEQATLHENLCQCYIGWCSFW